MSRKRTYRTPKTGRTFFDVISDHQPIPEADIKELLVQVHDSFASMRGGTGSDRDFDIVAEVLNVSLVRAESVGQPAVDVVRAAQAAMEETRAFHERHGRYGFTGPGLEALREGVELYEQIVRLSTPAQLRLAIEECKRRLRAGHVEHAAA